MKQAIITAALVAAGLVTASAQGTIKFYNVSPSYAVTVNGASIPTSSAAPKAYYFTVLETTTQPTSNNPITGGFWSDVTSGGTPVIGNNYALAGSISGTGAGSGVSVDGVAAGASAWFEVVGWSASLGTTWSAIASQLSSGTWNANGYYGVSSFGDVVTGGTVVAGVAAPAAAIFGAAPLITSGWALAPVSTPEPTSIALGVMGGLSLLALRRKKA